MTEQVEETNPVASESEVSETPELLSATEAPETVVSPEEAKKFLSHTPKAVTPEKAVTATKKRVEDDKKIESEDGVRVVNGISIRLYPVAANIMAEASTRIPDAEMATYTDKRTGKEEVNPASPTYLAKVAKIQVLRAEAAMNALVLFGVELLEPVPVGNVWLRKLKFINLISEEELVEASDDADGAAKDSFLRELFYKKYIVIDATTLTEIAKLSGVTEEMLASSRTSFPSN